MKNTGQVSLLWAAMVGIISLVFCVGLWILFNNIQTHMSGPAIAAGGNVVNITIISSLMNYTPILMLLGLVLFLLIISAANRGG